MLDMLRFYTYTLWSELWETLISIPLLTLLLQNAYKYHTHTYTYFLLFLFVYHISLWFRTYSKIMKKLITELCRGCYICNVIKIALKMSEGHLGSYTGMKECKYFIFTPFTLSIRINYKTLLTWDLTCQTGGSVLFWGGGPRDEKLWEGLP